MHQTYQIQNGQSPNTSYLHNFQISHRREQIRHIGGNLTNENWIVYLLKPRNRLELLYSGLNLGFYSLLKTKF